MQRDVLLGFMRAFSDTDPNQPDNDSDNYFDWEMCLRCSDVTKHQFIRIERSWESVVMPITGEPRMFRVSTYLRICQVCAAERE